MKRGAGLRRKSSLLGLSPVHGSDEAVVSAGVKEARTVDVAAEEGAASDAAAAAGRLGPLRP